MTRYTETDRVIALSGIFQAAQLARDIARKGNCDATAFEASREALFAFEPESVEAVFTGRKGVVVGLRALLRQLQNAAQRDMEISRYVISLLYLGDRLLRDSHHMQGLRNDLNALDRRRDHFDLDDSVVHEQLASIYQERISLLGPRIMIRGEPVYLQNPDNAARIRVGLLGGIRSAVLWRQAGGKKWRLLLFRRAIVSAARDIVDKTVG